MPVCRMARHLPRWATTALLTAAVAAPVTATHAVTPVSALTTTSFAVRYAAAATTATPADKDLNGDGIPDLLTVGGTSGLASGLWLATGAKDDDGATGAGRVNTPAVDIGANGTGVSTNGAPSDFDGAQAITGRFTADGVQDVLIYYPSGIRAGSGMVLKGRGDGSVLQSQLSGNEYTISGGSLTDANGNDPVQLVNAYNGSGNNYDYPDLIAISGNAAGGYYLDYYPNQNGVNNYPFPSQLNTATPTGGTDWNNWTIATAQLSSGTAMFLWNQSTGQLYLWEKVTFTDNGDYTGRLAYTQYEISTNWNRGVALSTLEAADINGDGVPDLWAVTPTGLVTANLISKLSTTETATVRTKHAQSLSGTRAD